MANNFRLKNIEINTKSYRKSLNCIENILKEYKSKDKAYLLFELSKIRNKIKKLEYIILIFKKKEEVVQNKIFNCFERYFEKFQLEFQDFLIILKWNKFGAIVRDLRVICKKKFISPGEDMENYKVLLKRLIKAG